MTGEPKANILLVDDNRSNLVALEVALSPLDQNVIAATSGRDALRQVLRRDFAVILLDVRMPDMDGFETAAMIRQRQLSEHTPIIFITAFDKASAEMTRGYALGAVDYIFSPIVPEVVRAKVSVFVELFFKTQEVKDHMERLRRFEEQEHRRRLADSEAGRREAETRFATLLEIAADAIIGVGDRFSVRLFNKGAERIFGYEPAEVLGRSLTDLVPHGLIELAQRFRRHASTETALISPPNEEVFGRRKDGTEFPADATVSQLANGEDTILILILRDITQRKRAEEEVRQLNHSLSQRLKYGVDMVADLASTLQPREVVSRLLYRAATSLRADQGLLLRIERNEPCLELSYSTEGQEYMKEPLLISAKALIGRAIAERQPILGGPIELFGEPAQSNWHLAILPLTLGDRVTAVLLLTRRDGPAFSAGDLELLGLIGNVAVVALRNAELFGAADEASRAKSSFLSMAAHELRTPLSVISGYVAMLEDGSLGLPPEQWKAPLQVLGQKGKELNRIVEDLLLASRMETGPVRLQQTVLDMRDVAQEALARADARAKLLNAEISCQFPKQPVPVLADREHLCRILDNLINNALNYSKGQPWVRVTVSGPDTPRILVEDRGVGIPSKLRERIFERFFRVDKHGLGLPSGTGLGLHIGRQLAELHGGHLKLERTEVGKGSVFALHLPPAGSAQQARTSRHVKQESLTQV